MATRDGRKQVIETRPGVVKPRFRLVRPSGPVWPVRGRIKRGNPTGQ